MEREVRFLCKRRSTLELETLLWDFFSSTWEGMDAEEREAYLTILRCEDVDLERWLLKNHPPSHRLNRDLIEKLRNHSLP